jgi:hypothetical protein
MRQVIRAFDTWLAKTLGVFEFSHDTVCLVRLRIARLGHRVDLPTRTLLSGSVILEIHLWNEHIPPIPPQGPDLAWASRTSRLFIRSLRSAARHARQLEGDSRPIAVVATTVLVPLGDPSGARSFLTRLGFHLIPAHNPLGRFGKFWENFYTWHLMWAYNAASLRTKQLLRIRRMEAWMPFDEFLRRYASDPRSM